MAEELDDPSLMSEELNGFLGYRLRRAEAAMHRHFIEALADLGLTQKQTATLWLINSNPGVSQVSVAAALGMDRASMMAIVDRNEERGLLIRKRSRDDRRRQELYLTPAGQSTSAQGEDADRRARGAFQIAVHAPRSCEFLLAALQRLQDATLKHHRRPYRLRTSSIAAASAACRSWCRSSPC